MHEINKAEAHMRSNPVWFYKSLKVTGTAHSWQTNKDVIRPGI